MNVQHKAHFKIIPLKISIEYHFLHDNNNNNNNNNNKIQNIKKAFTFFTLVILGNNGCILRFSAREFPSTGVTKTGVQCIQPEFEVKQSDCLLPSYIKWSVTLPPCLDELHQSLASMKFYYHLTRNNKCRKQ